jgi:iron-sulfur cluster repair protein YtfE (RIC family)
MVLPHHRSPGKEAELLAEKDELRRKFENVCFSRLLAFIHSFYFASQQKQLKQLLAKAARASRRHAKQAKMRLDRLSFI